MGRFLCWPKSAILKTMGYSPDCLAKIGRFQTHGTFPKSSQIVPHTVKNSFASILAMISGTYQSPPSSKPWAIAQAFCSKIFLCVGGLDPPHMMCSRGSKWLPRGELRNVTGFKIVYQTFPCWLPHWIDMWTLYLSPGLFSCRVVLLNFVRGPGWRWDSRDFSWMTYFFFGYNEAKLERF